MQDLDTLFLCTYQGLHDSSSIRDQKLQHHRELSWSADDSDEKKVNNSIIDNEGKKGDKWQILEVNSQQALVTLISPID